MVKLLYENCGGYKEVSLKCEGSMLYAPDRFTWSDISKAKTKELFHIK